MLEREGKPNKALKYWRLARDYVAKERRPLTNYHAALAAEMESIDQLANPLDHVDGATNHANSLLDLLDVYPPPSDMAQEAWRKAGRAPRDPGINQPLCKFVASALGASGFATSHDAVSSPLRPVGSCALRARLPA
jgi:hypothetical protein